MVYRVYVEKKPDLAHEAHALLADLRTVLQISTLVGLRILNRYDVEHIDADLFAQAKSTVFSEPQTDIVSDSFDPTGARVFAVEYLPGQFDQRADSAAQCIQIISQGDRPTVRTASSPPWPPRGSAAQNIVPWELLRSYPVLKNQATVSRPGLAAWTP